MPDTENSLKTLHLSEPTLEQLHSRYKTVAAFLDAHQATNPILAKFVQDAANEAEEAYDKVYYSIAPKETEGPGKISCPGKPPSTPLWTKLKDNLKTRWQNLLTKEPPPLTPPWWELNKGTVTTILALLLAILLGWPYALAALQQLPSAFQQPTTETGTGTTIITEPPPPTPTVTETPSIDPKVVEIWTGGYQPWNPPVPYITTTSLLTPSEAVHNFIWTYYSLIRDSKQALAFQAHTRPWQMQHNVSDFTAQNASTSPVFPASPSALPLDATTVQSASNDGAVFVTQNKYFTGAPGLTRFSVTNPGPGWQIEEEMPISQQSPAQGPADFVARYLDEISKGNYSSAYNNYLDNTLKMQLPYDNWYQVVTRDYQGIQSITPPSAIFIGETKSPNNVYPDSGSVTLDMRAFRSTGQPLKPNKQDSPFGTPQEPYPPIVTPQPQTETQTIEVINNNGEWKVFKISSAAASYVRPRQPMSNFSLVNPGQLAEFRNASMIGDFFGSIFLIIFLLVAFGVMAGGDVKQIVRVCLDLLLALATIVIQIIIKIVIPVIKIIVIQIKAILDDWIASKKQIGTTSQTQIPQSTYTQPPPTVPPTQPKTGNPFLDGLPPVQPPPDPPPKQPPKKTANSYGEPPDIEYIPK